MKATPMTVMDDRACVNCGYNLKGLRGDGVCPECGRAIRVKKKDIPRYTDALVNAPKMWLAGLAFGSTLLFASVLCVMTLFVVSLALPAGAKFAAAIMQLAAAAIWYIGVLISTQPRPVMPTTQIDPRKEWSGLRRSARITQVFWVLMPTCMAVYWYLYNAAAATVPRGAPPGDGLVWGAIACFAVGAVGLIWLCIYLSNIAFWGDDEIGANFRTCAWLVGAAATLTFLDTLNSMTNAILMGGFWASLVRVMFMFFVLLPAVYLVYCLFRMQRMARWALTNHSIADARNRRLQAQARKNAKRGPAAATSKVSQEGAIALARDSSVNPPDARPVPAPLSGPTGAMPKRTTDGSVYDVEQP